jgi:hypothetical protein
MVAPRKTHFVRLVAHAKYHMATPLRGSRTGRPFGPIRSRRKLLPRQPCATAKASATRGRVFVNFPLIEKTTVFSLSHSNPIRSQI